MPFLIKCLVFAYFFKCCWSIFWSRKMSIQLKSDLEKIVHYVLKAKRSEYAPFYFLFWWLFMSVNEMSPSKVLEMLVIGHITWRSSEKKVEWNVIRSWFENEIWFYPDWTHKNQLHILWKDETGHEVKQVILKYFIVFWMCWIMMFSDRKYI